MFCASQASTAICSTMDEASCSSSTNTLQLGGKAIDRHNPIICHSRRTTTLSSSSSSSSSSSHPPINNPQKKISSSKPSSIAESKNKNSANKKGAHHHDQKKKNVAESNNQIDSVLMRRNSSWIKQNHNNNGDLFTTTTPAGSTRCLLSDTGFFNDNNDGVSDYFDPALVLNNNNNNNNNNRKGQDEIQSETNTLSKPSSSSLQPKPASSNQPQEVVLRVSLHCKGCEGKVRKHLSRMQGVSSFKIDFASKKVTVVGDVSPLSLLASISKVKSAQFWSETNGSAVGSGYYGTIETKNKYFI